MARSKMSSAVDLVKEAGRRYGEDNGGRLAAALTYQTMFALVPILFLVVAIAGFVFSANTDAQAQLVSQVRDVVGVTVADQIDSLMTSAAQQRKGALWLGVALSAFSASGLFQQVQGVLDMVFEIPHQERRTGVIGWIVNRTIALGSALVLAVLALSPIVAVGAVGWISRTVVPESLGWLRSLLRFGVPVVSLVILMAVVGLTFQVLTAGTIEWKAAWRGGAVTAVLVLVAAALVGVYLGRFGASGTLAAIGGIAILMFFFNLLWNVYLLGAELTKAYADRLLPPVTSPPEPPAVPERPAPPGAIWAFVAGAALGWLGRPRR